jgi:hypothetical protein
MALLRGVEIYTFQFFLGHKAGRMTKRYASSEKQRSAILVLDEKETASAANFGQNEPFSEVGEYGNNLI